jgi:putative transposase
VVAAVVGSLQGTSALAVARQCGGRQRQGHGATFGTRDDAVSTVGCDEEHLRRSRRNQEQLDAPGRDEDGDFEESLRTCLWQPLGLLTTVKPPALRERYDSLS